MKSFRFRRLRASSPLRLGQGNKSASVSGTVVPRSALVSDLPVGDGARVEMQDARSEAATQVGGRGFSRAGADGGSSRCAAAIVPKSPGRRKWPGAAAPNSRYGIIRARTVVYINLHFVGVFSPDALRPTAPIGGARATNTLLRPKLRLTTWRAADGGTQLACAARRPDQLQINRDLEFLFPVDNELCLTDCQLIRKGKI
jgi:hypothetical protein